jgi:hypothetical protein
MLVKKFLRELSLRLNNTTLKKNEIIKSNDINIIRHEHL